MLHKIVVMLFMLLAPCAPMLAQQPTDDAGKQNTEVEEVEVPIMTQMGTVQYKGKTIPHIIMPRCPSMHRSLLRTTASGRSTTAWCTT